jgi:ABC-type glycerol-3-phosphate transport system substrate-binding protein
MNTMESWPRNRVIFVAVLVGVVFLSLLAIIFFRRKNPQSNPVTITVWGTVPKRSFDVLAAQYSGLRPNAIVNYSELDPATYDATLLNAFASGQGPDVFMTGNQDVIKHAPLISPATTTQFTAAQVSSLFPSAVGDNTVFAGRVYALPVSMDNLTLFYNRDLFDKAGIAVAPQTWQDVLNDIPKLRKVNAQGQLTQGAIALGGPESNIAHAADILSLLMLQNGATMTNAEGAAVFGESQNGAQAFRFYLDFENPSSAAYAWSDALGNSSDAFAAGQVAMMVGYRRDAVAIKAKSPFLNFALAPMVQTAADQNVSYPSYPVLTVWRQSKVIPWAWDFIVYSATNPGANKAYLAAADELPALRANIASANTTVSTLAPQALSAKSWQVRDYAKMKEILSNAIAAALRHDKTPEEALTAAAEQLNAIR